MAKPFTAKGDNDVVKTELTPKECKAAFDYRVKHKYAYDLYGVYEEFIGKFGKRSFRLKRHARKSCSEKSINRILCCYLFRYRATTYIFGRYKFKGFRGFLFMVAYVAILYYDLKHSGNIIYSIKVFIVLKLYIAYHSRAYTSEQNACAYFVIANFKCHQNSLGLGVKEAQELLDDFTIQGG